MHNMGSLRVFVLCLLYLQTYISSANGDFGLKESSAASTIKSSEFSASIGRKDFDDIEWQDDNNKAVSECKITLWARSTEVYPTEEITEMHWAIVFEWEDQTSTYEANESEGYLIPKWHSGLPRGEKWEKRVTQDWGTYNLSPQQVNQAAKKNRLNGFRYILGHINCQHWAGVLILDLGIKRPQETFAERSPFRAIFATAGRVAQGSIDALYPLAGSIIKDAIDVNANLRREDAIALSEYLLKTHPAGVKSLDLLQKDFPAIKEYLYKTNAKLPILVAAAIAIKTY